MHRSAAKLGAEQSLLGIVTRISRTDYNVTYKLRDARTRALVAVEQTDMRAGANDFLAARRSLADQEQTVGENKIDRANSSGI